jgi:hypothetical protein
MNFKSIKKFLKKNYKKIIIICLIILLFSNKMYENFSTTDALNAVASTEKKVNDIFYSIDKDWARSKKGLYSTYEVRGKTVRSMEDVISKRNITATGNVNAKKDVNADGNVKGKKLCIGGTCINEDILKKLNKKPHELQLPNQKGCWLYSYTSCKEKRGRGNEAYGQWFYDGNGNDRNSESKCKKRMAEYKKNFCKGATMYHKYNKKNSLY